MSPAIGLEEVLSRNGHFQGSIESHRATHGKPVRYPRSAAPKEQLGAVKGAVIMMVDDEPTILEVLEAFLEGEGYENFVTTTDSREALPLLESERPDVLLLDLIMPNLSGLEILSLIRNDQALKHTPVIILTSSSEEETKLEALELGASEFLAKPVDPSELALRLRNTLATKAYQDHLTYFDGLTGLPNRRLFVERTDRALERAGSRSRECAVLHIDLDRFNQINDALGHRVGDTVLKAVAERLEKSIRISDLLGTSAMQAESTPLSRVGGDEFLLFLRGDSLHRPRSADRAADPLRDLGAALHGWAGSLPDLQHRDCALPRRRRGRRDAGGQCQCRAVQRQTARRE